MIRQLAMTYESIIGSSSQFGLSAKKDDDDYDYDDNVKEEQFDKGAACGGLF